MKIAIALAVGGLLGLAPGALDDASSPSRTPQNPPTPVNEHLGFTAFGGEAKHGWLMLRNGDTVLGLFQGMFERNCLTFNPGWDQQAQETESFTDVRELQRRLEDADVELTTRADPDSTGPASFTLLDPDGNPVLVDQHRPRPDR